MKSFLAIAAILALYSCQIADAIKCIQCQKSPSITYPPGYNCSSSDLKQLPEAAECGGGYDVCLKSFEKVSTGDIWKRKCSVASSSDLGKDSCTTEKEGTEVKSTMCHCSKDGCNGTGSLAQHVAFVGVVCAAAALWRGIF